MEILSPTIMSSQFPDYNLDTFITVAPQGGGKWTGDGTYCSIVDVDNIGKCIELSCNSDSASNGFILISKEHLKNLGISNGNVVRIGAYCKAVNKTTERRINIGHSIIHVNDTESSSPQWIEFTTTLDTFNGKM